MAPGMGIAHARHVTAEDDAFDPLRLHDGEQCGKCQWEQSEK